MGIILPPYCTYFYNTNLKSEKNWMKKDLKLLSKNLIRMTTLIKNQKWGYQGINIQFSSPIE